MTAVELLERATDPALTPGQRAQAARDYGREVAADFAIDAYSLANRPAGGAR